MDTLSTHAMDTALPSVVWRLRDAGAAGTCRFTGSDHRGFCAHVPISPGTLEIGFRHAIGGAFEELAAVRMPEAPTDPEGRQRQVVARSPDGIVVVTVDFGKPKKGTVWKPLSPTATVTIASADKGRFKAPAKVKKLAELLRFNADLVKVKVEKEKADKRIGIMDSQIAEAKATAKAAQDELASTLAFWEGEMESSRALAADVEERGAKRQRLIEDLSQPM